MAQRRLRLSGFEREVLDIISDGFRFESETLRSYALKPGRNLFAGDIPAASDIAITASDADNGLAYDEKREPAIALYRQPGSGIPSTSSSGSRLEFNELLVLRAPRTLDEAVDLLGELVVWLELEVIGRTSTHYKIVGFKVLGMPVPFQRLNDDQSAASATVRFLAVALS